MQIAAPVPPPSAKKEEWTEKLENKAELQRGQMQGREITKE